MNVIYHKGMVQHACVRLIDRYTSSPFTFAMTTSPPSGRQNTWVSVISCEFGCLCIARLPHPRWGRNCANTSGLHDFMYLLPPSSIDNVALM